MFEPRAEKTGSPRSRFLRVRAAALGVAVGLGAVAGLSADPMSRGGAEDARTTLGVLPIGWAVVGLDAADVATGPDRTLIGVRVCNTGPVAAAAVRVTWEWRSDEPRIERTGPAEFAMGSLQAGECRDVHSTVVVARDATVIGATRDYEVLASADNAATVGAGSTVGRVLQVRTAAAVRDPGDTLVSLSGVPSTVRVGDVVTVVVTASTVTTGYDQLVALSGLDTSYFDIRMVSLTAASPSGTAVEGFRIDACAWMPDPAPLGACSASPAASEPGPARVGGDPVVLTVVARAVRAGTTTVHPVIYGTVAGVLAYADDATLDATTTITDPPAPDLSGPAAPPLVAAPRPVIVPAAPARPAATTVPTTPTTAPTVPAVMATPDAVVTPVATPVVTDPLANDTSVGGTLVPGSVLIVRSPLNGVATADRMTGRITYSPNRSFQGTDALTYRVCNTATVCAESTVTYTVGDVPTPIRPLPFTGGDTAPLAVAGIGLVGVGLLLQCGRARRA